MSLIARKWVPMLIKIQMCFMIYYAKALREIAREVRLTDCHHRPPLGWVQTVMANMRVNE